MDARRRARAVYAFQSMVRMTRAGRAGVNARLRSWTVHRIILWSLSKWNWLTTPHFRTCASGGPQMKSIWFFVKPFGERHVHWRSFRQTKNVLNMRSFWRMQKSIKSLPRALMGEGVNFPTILSLPGSCDTLQLKSPMVKHCIPRRVSAIVCSTSSRKASYSSSVEALVGA